MFIRDHIINISSSFVNDSFNRKSEIVSSLCILSKFVINCALMVRRFAMVKLPKFDALDDETKEGMGTQMIACDSPRSGSFR